MGDIELLDLGGPARVVVAFCRMLRSEGLRSPVADVFTFIRALDALGVTETDSVYWAGRATLVRRPEDIELYDRAFAAFWGSAEAEGPMTLRPPRVVPPERQLHTEEAAVEEGLTLSLSYSRAEALREKNFATCTPAELAEAMAMLRVVPTTQAVRLSHRWRSARKGTRLDIRSTVRRSMRNGGEIVVLNRAHRLPRLRRVVLVADISGSMEPYARAILRFAHILVAGRARVEAFALGTRLTRITRQLSSRDPDAAMVSASAAVRDWSGGTRLGTGLREFNDRFGITGMARGSQVVILSDGWDRGDPEELASQMARLHRVAHQVIWVNPLKATPGYEPLTQGMAAALPYVDRFLPGHNLSSLSDLLTALAD